MVEYRPGMGAHPGVLTELGQAPWSAEEAVAYEVALEGVNQVIAFYSGLIGQEESAAEPDSAAIAGWRGEQQAWAARRRRLSPLDTEAVRSIRDEGEDLLAEPGDDE
jgi:hypothetical protein